MFTINKVPISPKALDFPLIFHMFPVNLRNIQNNLLSSSGWQPVWVCYHFFGFLEKRTIQFFFTSNKVPIALMAKYFPLCFHMIPVNLGITFFGTLIRLTIRFFFTTNKMPVSLKALDFPFHFHMIQVSLGNTGRNLLSFSECQPVWVKPLFVPVWP